MAQANHSSGGENNKQFPPLTFEKYRFKPLWAYGQSKLAQIMFTFDLAREFDPTAIAANCLHPATYKATTMVRQSGVTPISTVEEGAEAILNLALSKELDGHSGEFYNGLRPSRANAQAYNHRARERLRALSMRLTGLA